jgi:hypothetical protein
MVLDDPWGGRWPGVGPLKTPSFGLGQGVDTIEGLSEATLGTPPDPPPEDSEHLYKTSGIDPPGGGAQLGDFNGGKRSRTNPGGGGPPKGPPGVITTSSKNTLRGVA